MLLRIDGCTFSSVFLQLFSTTSDIKLLLAVDNIPEVMMLMNESVLHLKIVVDLNKSSNNSPSQDYINQTQTSITTNNSQSISGLHEPGRSTTTNISVLTVEGLNKPIHHYITSLHHTTPVFLLYVVAKLPAGSPVHLRLSKNESLSPHCQQTVHVGGTTDHK